MTVIETQSYGSRLVESIKGVLFGVVIFLIAFPLLFWNEGRAVQTAKSLAEGESSVVSVIKLDPANEGKLVHFSGQVTTNDTLSDQEFGVKSPGIRLQRLVEMYQWYEKKNSHENVGGSKTTVTDYDQKWSAEAISSDHFKETGHENPSHMRVAPHDEAAVHAMLGDFKLSQEIILKHVDKWETIAVDPSKIPAATRAKVKTTGELLYMGDDPAHPKVGDCRITYRVVKSPLSMSIVAEQQGPGFIAYPAKAGDAILLTAMEAKDAKSMFKTAEAENASLTWILRGVGWFMMTLGLFLVLRPLAMIANFIPAIGSFISLGAFALAAAAGSALSLVTIAIAWVVYRPIIGIALLVCALGATALGVVMMMKARHARARAL